VHSKKVKMIAISTYLISHYIIKECRMYFNFFYRYILYFL